MNKQKWGAISLALLVSACANTPPSPTTSRVSAARAQHNNTSSPAYSTVAPASRRYLAGENVPAPEIDDQVDIDSIPDAVPIDEPLHPYANRPYTAYNESYTPILDASGFRERGIASWYGIGFEGKTTAGGDVCDLYSMTAAHVSLPIPSYVRVTNLENGRSVVVRINDRGPYQHPDRIINLSYVAAKKLDIILHGTAEVEIESVFPDTAPPSRRAGVRVYERNAPLMTINPKR